MGSISESPAGKAYLVDYDENAFLAFDEERQQDCIDAWTKRAGPLGCEVLAIRLRPDTIFPLHGHETPYIWRSIPLEGDKPALFRVDTVCYVNLTEAWHRLPDLEKLKQRQLAREAGMKSGADRWEVKMGTAKMDEGRNKRG